MVDANDMRERGVPMTHTAQHLGRMHYWLSGAVRLQASRTGMLACKKATQLLWETKRPRLISSNGASHELSLGADLARAPPMNDQRSEATAALPVLCSLSDAVRAMDQ
jgi:hypothetical protein